MRRSYSAWILTGYRCRITAKLLVSIILHTGAADIRSARKIISKYELYHKDMQGKAAGLKAYARILGELIYALMSV